MKKSVVLLALVLFVAIAWAGTTYVVGNKAEAYYLQLLEDSSQFGFISFTNKSYERGFLQSKAETLMVINLPGFPAEAAKVTDIEPAAPTPQVFQVVLEHTLYHGPLPSSSGPASRYGFGPAIALVETTLTEFTPDQVGLEQLLEEIPELKNAVSVSKIRLDGTIDGYAEVPSFLVKLEDGQFSSDGFKAETFYSLVDGSMAGTYDIQGMALSMPENGSMSWHGMTGEFTLQKALPLLYVGPNKANIGRMEMSLPDPLSGEPQTFSMHGMEFAMDSSFDGTKVDYQQLMTFKGIDVEGKTYGPIVIDVETKNLDARTLSEYQKAILRIYKDIGTLDPDAMAAEVMPVYVDLFSRLLAGDPEMNVRNFSVVTPMGNAEGTFNLKFHGLKTFSFEDPAGIQEALQHIDSAADIIVDESLVRSILIEQTKSSLTEQAEMLKQIGQNPNFTDEQIEEMADQQFEQQLEMLTAQNFIKREEGRIKSNMTFTNGELKVNGQLLPL